jgi:hypothetical protein
MKKRMKVMRKSLLESNQLMLKSAHKDKSSTEALQPIKFLEN